MAEDKIRVFSKWVVTALGGGGGRALQPHRVAAELQSSATYGDEKPVNQETIRKIIRFGECLLEGKPLPVAPSPTAGTLRRLAHAICTHKNLDVVAETGRLGLLLAAPNADGEEDEPPEASEAFSLIESFYDCRQPFARVRRRLRTSEGPVAGAIEVEATAAMLPAMTGNEYLVIAIKSASAAVLRHIVGSLEELERAGPYVAIDLIYDVAEESHSAVRRLARDRLSSFVTTPEAVSARSLGEFLGKLFDTQSARTTLREQYAKVSAASANIDPFSDEDFYLINSTVASSGLEAGAAPFGDHLDEQLRRLVQADHPVRCMVRGTFGAGKTTAIYRAAAMLIRAAEQASDGETFETFLETPRPVIIPAASVLGGSGVLEQIAEALRIWYALPVFVDGARAASASSFIDQLIRVGVIVVFIDSLDESPSLSQADRISELLDTLPGFRSVKHSVGGEKLNRDRSKYVLTYRPEIFQSMRVEDRLLYLNRFAIEELRDYTYTLTLMGPREPLRSPFGEDVFSRSEPNDVSSVVRVSDALIRSLSDSPLFRSMSAQGGFDVQSLRRSADEFVHREGETPRFLFELYNKFSDLADRWESRERKRDSSRLNKSSNAAHDRWVRLDGCTQIALAMLGREDCSREPGRSEPGKLVVSYALPAADLRRIAEQNLLNTERVRDQIDQGRQKEELQLTAWYDARVGMMLVAEPDTGSSDRQGRWRFPNIAMEALFMARGLYHMLNTFERGHIDPAALEYPFEPHAVVGPLCRSLIDDRLRGAVMLLAGKVLSERPEPIAYPNDVLAALRDASRSGNPQSDAGICVSEHPVLALNVATICIWLKDLLEFGAFQADLRQLPLAGLNLRGWTWPDLDTSDVPKVSRVLRVGDAILEDAHIQGFQLIGEPLLRGALERPERVRLMALLGPVDIRNVADDPAADRWSIIPGGIFSVPTFHADTHVDRASSRTVRKRNARERAFEGGRDMAQSVLMRQADGKEVQTNIFVPTFMMQQTPTSNAQFLYYLQNNRSEGWPLEERQRTSNPWYLYDWSHIEFLFGSDLLQWPNKKLSESFRALAHANFSDQDTLRHQLGVWLKRRRSCQETQRQTFDIDPIEARGWLFSLKGPFALSAESDVLSLLEKDEGAVKRLVPILQLFENWLHRPLTRVNWRVASRFARHHGWSLPSEAEFEAAASWWREIAKTHARPPEALREVEIGYASGAELWHAVKAQLHAYQPNISFTKPPWKSGSDQVGVSFTELVSGKDRIFNPDYLKLADAYRSAWPGFDEAIERIMPPAFLTGMIGTWTRDIYDPSWPLGFAALYLPDTAEHVLFHPVNNGVVDAQRFGGAKEEGPAPVVGNLGEEPLRAIRGRGLRFGWPRGSEYRFGQQETNVNPDVGLRCVKHLHLVVP